MTAFTPLADTDHAACSTPPAFVSRASSNGDGYAHYDDETAAIWLTDYTKNSVANDKLWAIESIAFSGILFPTTHETTPSASRVGNLISKVNFPNYQYKDARTLAIRSGISASAGIYRADSGWLSLSSASTALSPSSIDVAEDHSRQEGVLHVTELLQELSFLSNGWAGDGSQAPTPQVLSDIKTALFSLQQSVRQPEIEVDEDGSVALLWSDKTHTFAMTFYGNSQVIGTVSPYSPAISPWQVNVAEKQAILRHLTSSEIAVLLS